MQNCSHFQLKPFYKYSLRQGYSMANVEAVVELGLGLPLNCPGILDRRHASKIQSPSVVSVSCPISFSSCECYSELRLHLFCMDLHLGRSVHQLHHWQHFLVYELHRLHHERTYKNLENHPNHLQIELIVRFANFIFLPINMVDE